MSHQEIYFLCFVGFCLVLIVFLGIVANIMKANSKFSRKEEEREEKRKKKNEDES